MERDKPKKFGIGWTNFAAVVMETKKGGFNFLFDSFHQTSWNSVGISTVVCGSHWGIDTIQNGGRFHGNQGAKMLNSFQAADPFETWHKNRSSIKVVLFVFKIIKMAANITNKKMVKNISTISWWSVLLMEETGIPGETQRPVASHWQTLSHNDASSTPRHERASNSQHEWW